MQIVDGLHVESLGDDPWTLLGVKAIVRHGALSCEKIVSTVTIRTEDRILSDMGFEPGDEARCAAIGEHVGAPRARSIGQGQDWYLPRRQSGREEQPEAPEITPTRAVGLGMTGRVAFVINPFTAALARLPEELLIGLDDTVQFARTSPDERLEQAQAPTPDGRLVQFETSRQGST